MEIKINNWYIHTDTNGLYRCVGTISVKTDDVWEFYVKYVDCNGKEYARPREKFINSFKATDPPFKKFVPSPEEMGQYAYDMETDTYHKIPVPERKTYPMYPGKSEFYAMLSAYEKESGVYLPALHKNVMLEFCLEYIYKQKFH